MTLLDAPTYNARRARVIRNSIIAGLVAVVVIAAATWWFWNWPAQRRDPARLVHYFQRGNYATGLA